MSIDSPMREEPDEFFTDPESEAVLYEEQVAPEYGVLGFTVRELVIIGAWLVAFVVSFLPVVTRGGTVWTSGISWLLTIGVPTLAVFLIVLRRFSPDGIRRVGSLGIDQFASVAASVAAIAWAQLLWGQISASLATGAFLVGWVTIIAQVATLVLVASTVAAPLIPRLREDFHGRMETLAHRNANPVRPVIARPKPAPVGKFVAADPADPADDADLADESAIDDRDADDWAADDRGGNDRDTDARDADDPAANDRGENDLAADGAGDSSDFTLTDVIGDLPWSHSPTAPPVAPEPSPDHSAAPVVEFVPAAEDSTSVRTSADIPAEHVLAPVFPEATEPEPFWVLAASEREVFDERGQPLFRIGPSAWTLVIEDRGGAYVVRHDDGRIGYLHDISDMTKG
ncbi:hypothetical protein FM104_02220 [Microbacterium esteraromaticum]|uniref:Uncharacterized protein n=1 Tax=Microbacterium esteraromaticum TaxID=57043 RepID=A0A1R4IHL2_9MICO|nr:hypothetical protein [Microbacterium esteraromaticum]SJN19317.1 hypothetical protein FM104_02220 [Microbacterium esteraromaticum]